jgi:type II secretory pathway pseudopilin PulG
MDNRDPGSELIEVKDSRGFSMLEIMVVVGIFMIVASVVFPKFTKLIYSYRRDAAMQQLAGDTRRARTEAIRTGWQYRIFGFNHTSTSAFKNQYRLMARSSGAVAWPADSVAAFTSTTQMAGQWVNIPSRYPGVRLNPSDGTERFWVAFDSRGVRIELDDSFDPLYVVHQTESFQRQVDVTAVGSVKTQ